MKKNALIRGAAVLMAAVLLAGCGSGSSETQTEAAATAAETEAAAEAETEAETESEVEKPAASGDYKDGTYTAKAAGLNGDVVMTVEIEGGNIISLTSENVETEAIFEGVERDLYPEILEKQTVDGIDTITGATYASTAVLEAVGECLEEASN